MLSKDAIALLYRIRNVAAEAHRLRNKQLAGRIKLTDIDDPDAPVEARERAKRFVLNTHELAFITDQLIELFHKGGLFDGESREDLLRQQNKMLPVASRLSLEAYEVTLTKTFRELLEYDTIMRLLDGSGKVLLFPKPIFDEWHAEYEFHLTSAGYSFEVGNYDEEYMAYTIQIAKTGSE